MPRRSSSLSNSSSRMFDSSGESGPPCGVPSRRAVASPFDIIPACRYLRIKSQHSLVFDSPRQPRHQDVVVDSVEELLQIDIYHPAPPFAHILRGLLALPDARSVAAESRSSIPKSSVQRVGLVLDVTPAVSVGLPPSECPTSAFLCHPASVSLPSAPAAVDSFLPTVLL